MRVDTTTYLTVRLVTVVSRYDPENDA
jgi:hypothetical protein